MCMYVYAYVYAAGSALKGVHVWRVSTSSPITTALLMHVNVNVWVMESGVWSAPNDNQLAAGAVVTVGLPTFEPEIL